MTDLTQLSPAEVDALWIEAVKPLNSAVAARHEQSKKLRRYEKFGQTPDWLVAAIAALDEKIEALRPLEMPFLAEWDRRNGWTRAYVVPAGHIHKSTYCSSLHPTTQIGWLPEQSGWDEAAIVEAAGVHACTICYPSAPVEALRVAEAAAKAASECPGSRSYDHDSSGLRYASPRARCNHCGATVSATSTGKLRAHKPAPVAA